MEKNEIVWEAYGDVNPIKHGGVWALTQKDRDNAFFLVELINLDSACGEPGFLVSEAYVDLEDDWIELDSIKSFIGAEEDTSPVEIALGVLSYYGPENCGGTRNFFETEGEAVEDVEAHGIDL